MAVGFGSKSLLAQEGISVNICSSLTLKQQLLPGPRPSPLCPLTRLCGSRDPRWPSLPGSSCPQATGH